MCSADAYRPTHTLANKFPFSLALSFIQGNVVLTRNGTELIKYADYEVEGLLRLSKDLEFNEDTNKGDTLYIKRFGKKDIILRLEKKGTADKDVNGHWANNTGDIVMPEPLTGNYFNWTEGQSLKIGEQLDYNDVVKGLDGRYYKYTGTAIAYEDMPADNKKVIVNTSGIFWEDITVSELEYERKGNNYKIFNVDNGDTIIHSSWYTAGRKHEAVVPTNHNNYWELSTKPEYHFFHCRRDM